jgi:hypothetical protein
MVENQEIPGYQAQEPLGNRDNFIKFRVFQPDFKNFNEFTINDKDNLELKMQVLNGERKILKDSLDFIAGELTILSNSTGLWKEFNIWIPYEDRWIHVTKDARSNVFTLDSIQFRVKFLSSSSRIIGVFQDNVLVACIKKGRGFFSNALQYGSIRLDPSILFHKSTFIMILLQVAVTENSPLPKGLDDLNRDLVRSTGVSLMYTTYL